MSALRRLTGGRRGAAEATTDRKPLEEQVIVLTGASSGIGLTTARLAADRGARVVLAARSEAALREATEGIEADGGDATSVVADVRDRDDVREIARTARETYGGVDTWVNGAAVSIYGRLEDVPVEDMREQFETNVWGVVYGSLEAAAEFRDRGGTIVNVGSIVSERSLPYQGSYAASKHAVEAFTDALRMELEADGAPVDVTLVKPSATDTPYPQHAKNYMDREATLPPPVYAPETVARAILHAAERPQREVTVGGGGKGMVAFGRLAPRLLDRVMAALFADQQRTDRPSRPVEENALDEPSGDLGDPTSDFDERSSDADERAGAPAERGGYEGRVAESSLYTRLRQRGRSPGALALAAAAVAGYAGYRALRRST